MIRMTPHKNRDIKRGYPGAEIVSKLRRLADALETGKLFSIQVAGERLRIGHPLWELNFRSARFYDERPGRTILPEPANEQKTCQPDQQADHKAAEEQRPARLPDRRIVPVEIPRRAAQAPAADHESERIEDYRRHRVGGQHQRGDDEQIGAKVNARRQPNQQLQSQEGRRADQRAQKPATRQRFPAKGPQIFAEDPIAHPAMSQRPFEFSPGYTEPIHPAHKAKHHRHNSMSIESDRKASTFIPAILILTERRLEAGFGRSAGDAGHLQPR